jgi:hypothetical protein
MKVVHIESGLGNQMLDYAEYIAIKMFNPNEPCYIENMIYEIKECHSKISMWNGYEIEKIFRTKEPNIKELFTDRQWEGILKDVSGSKFWLDNWRYSDAINAAFAKEGLILTNVNSRPTLKEKEYSEGRLLKKIRASFIGTYFGYTFKRILFKLLEKSVSNSEGNIDKLFYSTDDNIYGGHFLKFYKKGNGIERIEDQIRKVFKFPELTDEKNLMCLSMIKSTNSVAIHARRGDMLSINGYCYKFGYFKRAVKFIKKKVNNPVFFFFCDMGSSDWCKENYEIFGINPLKDTVHFVDWNKGDDSYKDMQLMSQCKHNIITNSSFGWWASYLNENPNKITCSPDIRINTTHSF